MIGENGEGLSAPATPTNGNEAVEDKEEEEEEGGEERGEEAGMRKAREVASQKFTCP